MKKGISLIVLVITIVIIIILATAVILTITLNNPIKSAKEASFKSDASQLNTKFEIYIFNENIKANEEDRYFNIEDVNLDSTTTPTINEALRNLDKSKLKGKIIVKNGKFIFTGEDKKEQEWFIAATSGEINAVPETVQLLASLFDETGEKNGKLHIGDFVNYDAGNWTKSEIENIKVGSNSSLTMANNNVALPNTPFGFGGFVEGDSRNGNATPFDANYSPLETGWRVFDVENDKVLLISAGCPEDYYNEFAMGFPSQYVLTGTINSAWKTPEDANKYTVRNYDVYNNGKAEKVSILTKDVLDEWYGKYKQVTNPDVDNDSIYRTVYGTKYESLIDNYSYYWLSIAFNGSNLFRIDPKNKYVNSNNSTAIGIRPLILLKSDVQAIGEPIEKIVTSRGKTYKYNEWNIK